MFRSARISSDGTYRATLTRWLNPYCKAKCCSEGAFPREGYIAWVLNNPSTADADSDDPTIRRLWGFTRLYGFNAMHVVNTNPYRSTDPKGALIPPEDVLTINDQWLKEVHKQSFMTICAWGDKANDTLARRASLLLHEMGGLYALRVTKQGNPQHPLYLPGATVPSQWVPSKWIN